jgi:L-threonylcarbamoyladenylate synthase
MSATILQPHDDAFTRAAAIITRGGLVAFPTETVYGLGACAFDPEAVAKVFEAKRRPSFDPLIVHLAAIADLPRVCRRVNAAAQLLIDHFWPGPLTLVLPKSADVPAIVTSGLETVAVRMPAHPVARRLIQAAETPLAAPSANRFGRLSPTTAAHVAEQLGQDIDLILDGGPCPIGVESTIIDLSGDRPMLLRPGGIAREDLEKFVGQIAIAPLNPTPQAPGQLPSHYAPRTPLKILVDHAAPLPSTSARVGLLAFKAGRERREGCARQEILSAAGDLREAAQRLFACLHRLDEAGLDVIYAEPLPEIGLGQAIMDRLRKAEGATRE